MTTPMTLDSKTFNTFTCLRLSLYKRNQPRIPFREYNDIINWSCKFHETPVMFMHRGVQQIASDFSIYTDRLNYAKQLRTVSRLLFAEHTIQWKLINFRKGILVIFVNLFNHNFFQVTDITFSSILVFLQVYKNGHKISSLGGVCICDLYC